MPIDLSLFNTIHGFAGSSPVIDDVGVFFARYAPYGLVLAFLVFLFFERSWKLQFYYFALGLLSVILSWGITLPVIRFFYNRPRPPLALSFTPLIPFSQTSSFPSSHASFFFALGTALFLMNRRWGIWFLFVASLMGIARVFVGVHWPSDILAGAFFGIMSAAIIKNYIPKSRLTLLRDSEILPPPQESV